MFKVIESDKFFSVDVYDVYKGGFCKFNMNLYGLTFETFIDLISKNDIPHEKVQYADGDAYALALIFADYQLLRIKELVKQHRIEMLKDHIQHLQKELAKSTQELLSLTA